ncbi:Coenzyme F420 hydrogenase/dehydrogenase, beta subunit C-terminal domain [uncultured Succiniclasticum sp.]|uniref:Coenzyme F420 hydrogenase/dehydrogenase, beta subunit C-terminal domain n=1 Tax=uncultured Succiniclasticum sp. TaxID=1500547 RepID=UPI0025D7D1DA|nr:Coenzyme F420 hydrogenase/dehydrogenase, beta subunit C-terminal domain [uncultured Succiniclasticum sp.]
MIVICSLKECTGCEACVAVCPVNCISMKENKDGFYYPEINIDKCIECKKCVKTCPNNTTIKRGTPKFYMGWHKNTDILLNSSSGGAFTAIAMLVLQEKGVVYGAFFNERKHCVEHIGIDSVDSLAKLRLSKYFQSRIYDCYKKAEIDLKGGRYVLFTGTGCQVAGLYQYLNREYDRLLTVDVLCHGITSKKVVDEFIRSKKKKYKKEISTFRFRIKPPDSNWMSGGGVKMRLDFSDGTQIIEEKGADTFIVGFNANLFLRESCYSCKYVGTKRISDITLSDFWGVDLKRIPEAQKRNGVSLIIANSDRGKGTVAKLVQDMIIMPVDSESATKSNRSLKEPCIPNDKRGSFFAQLGKNDFDSLVKRYLWKTYLKIYTRRAVGDTVYNALKKLSRR